MRKVQVAVFIGVYFSPPLEEGHLAPFVGYPLDDLLGVDVGLLLFMVGLVVGHPLDGVVLAVLHVLLLSFLLGDAAVQAQVPLRLDFRPLHD